MDKIEVKVLNPEAITSSETMLVAMARLTQRAHTISSMADFTELLSRTYTKDTLKKLTALPHPTLQKFGVVNIAIVGASRRFLAQITRHQNEVKFMSGSLQYSDYSNDAQFCVPYEIFEADAKGVDIGYGDMCFNHYRLEYLNSCMQSMDDYRKAAKIIGNDAAGYMAPQGLRNVLVISATPYQWKHMISQRSCKRNTKETQYVMLRCWEELLKLSPMFNDCGAPCMQSATRGKCPEGSMTCGECLYCYTPSEALDGLFPLIRGTDND